MSRMLTATLAALTLATASLAIPGEAVAKGKGFGKQIHDSALGYAAAHGCTKMALHTAQPAAALIAMYQSWGYALVGTCDWRPHTNFLSVLMSKPLAATHSTNAA